MSLAVTNIRTILSTMLVSLLAALSSTHAQTPVLSPNSSISGDFTGLSAELEPLSEENCPVARCETSLANVPLTVRASGYPGGVSIQLIHAKVLNQTTREQSPAETRNSRPILLRGFARVRHFDGGKTERLNVAGTIFRSPGSAPILELSLPPLRPHGKRGLGIALVRAALPSRDDSRTTLQARYGKASAHAFPHATCGAAGGESAFSARSENTPRGSRSFAALRSYKVVYVATDFDPAFAKRLKCTNPAECNNKIVSIINQAAVFYEKQLGMTLEVARQFGPTAHTRSTDSGEVLNAFIDFNDVNRSESFHDGVNTGPNLVDVFALFTGRAFDEGIIGLAYLNTGCSDIDARYATLEVQRTASALDPITAAHEIGHIFGATHDPKGTKAIMMPGLSEETPMRFSSLSASAITKHVNSTYSECRQGTSAGAQNLSATSVSLAASKNASGRFTLSIAANELQPESCSISIRASARSNRAASGRLIKKFVPTSRTTSLSGTVKRLIAGTSEMQSNVYLRAFYTCADGTTVARSSVRLINPNSSTSLAVPKVTRSDWIKLLDKAFR